MHVDALGARKRLARAGRILIFSAGDDGRAATSTNIYALGHATGPCWHMISASAHAGTRRYRRAYYAASAKPRRHR